MTNRVLLFSRFERFWHWMQAGLIITLLLTGFTMHGTFHVSSFQTAFIVHVSCALALIVLWLFAIFWHFTTGEWRQYVPTTRHMLDMIRYYSLGIFTNEPHPVKKTRWSKHNPLQRATYLFLKLLLNPLIWLSGLLLLTYPWKQVFGISNLPLGEVALVHTAAAYAFAVFLVVHVYVITTGPTLLTYLKGMITGYEDLEE